MALEYLNARAVSFAAANWSDATGFDDNATLVAKLTGQNVSSDLDYSGLTTGINRLYSRSGRTGRWAPRRRARLRLTLTTRPAWDSANSTRSRLEVFANSGQFYIAAAGASAVISNTFIDTGGAFFFAGGTFTAAKVTRHVQRQRDHHARNARRVVPGVGHNRGQDFRAPRSTCSAALARTKWCAAAPVRRSTLYGGTLRYAPCLVLLPR